MERLIGRTLYSRVNSNATCKILAVSPGSKRVYFCEITEFRNTDYLALSEMNVQKYYSKENNQDLLCLHDSLYEPRATMKPDRIGIKEIRGAFNAIADGHPGVITTLHGATPHQELTDLILDRLKEGKLYSDSTGTGMTTICRYLDDFPDKNQKILFPCIR